MSENKQIAIIGYSGHAYVCIETAQIMNLEVVGYHDNQELKANPYNLSFLGTEEDFENHSASLFCSIGDNNIRQRVYNKIAVIQKDIFTSLQHPTAIVSTSATIGANTLISAGAVINALSTIETGCIINTGAIIEHECKIAAFAHIAPGAVVLGNVSVGERTFIGANAVVKQGIRIGKDVIVGAGSVVIKDVPDNQTVVGNPAKQLIKN